MAGAQMVEGESPRVARQRTGKTVTAKAGAAAPSLTDEMVDEPGTAETPSLATIDAKPSLPPGVVMRDGRIDPSAYEEVQAPVLRRDVPIIDAVVIYLGNKRNQSACLPGRLDTDEFEVADAREASGIRMVVRKKVSSEGTTSYDFSTHDAIGRLILSHIMPPTSQYAGRRYTKCENPEHLYWFFRQVEAGSTLYRVLPAAEQRKALEEFMFKKERALGDLKSLMKDTSGSEHLEYHGASVA